MQKYKVFTDGGARGNPGPAGIGVVVYSQDGKVVKRIAKYIGETTNNQAEYKAVIEALSYFQSDSRQLIADSISVDFYLDSQLIVEQMNGRYKIKNEGLKPLYFEIREKIMELGGAITFAHVPREQNKEADALVNEALDNRK